MRTIDALLSIHISIGTDLKVSLVLVQIPSLGNLGREFSLSLSGRLARLEVLSVRVQWVAHCLGR